MYLHKNPSVILKNYLSGFYRRFDSLSQKFRFTEREKLRAKVVISKKSESNLARVRSQNLIITNGWLYNIYSANYI